MWRPILSTPQLCTLHELKTIYDIDDLMDMHEALDMYDDAMKKAHEGNSSDKKENRIVIDGGVK